MSRPLLLQIIAFISVGRAAGALLSPWLFNQGSSLGLPPLLFNAAGAVFLNLIALASIVILWKGLRHVES